MDAEPCCGKCAQKFADWAANNDLFCLRARVSVTWLCPECGAVEIVKDAEPAPPRGSSS